MGHAIRGPSRGGCGRRRAAGEGRGPFARLTSFVRLGLAGLTLAGLTLAGCAGTSGAQGTGSCPTPTTGRIARDDRDLLVLVDPAPSLSGEAPLVRGDLLDGLDAWAACDGRAGGTLRLAFTTTGRPDGAPVQAAGSPTILDTTRLAWADLRRLAAADLDAALAGGSGPEGIRVLTRAVTGSGIRRPGVPLQADVITDWDDASPGDPAADAQALTAEAPDLHLELLASVDASGAPAILHRSRLRRRLHRGGPHRPPVRLRRGGGEPALGRLRAGPPRGPRRLGVHARGDGRLRRFHPHPDPPRRGPARRRPPKGRPHHHPPRRGTGRLRLAPARRDLRRRRRLDLRPGTAGGDPAVRPAGLGVHPHPGQHLPGGRHRLPVTLSPARATVHPVAMSLTLRFATADDAETLHRFIVALATFEREPDAVEATPASLAAQLRAAPPPFECLLAEDEGEAVGFALFFHNYSTWRGRPGLYLEDLFVPEANRGKGVGTALLTRLAAVAVARGCARMEWAVLDWNEKAMAFYDALGARGVREWVPYRLTGEALRALAAEDPGEG